MRRRRRLSITKIATLVSIPAILAIWTSIAAPLENNPSGQLDVLRKKIKIEKKAAEKKPSETKTDSKKKDTSATRETEGATQAAGEGVMSVWVKKEYPWDNPLQSEFSINGKTINIYTSDTSEPIQEYLKQGWNTITIKTTPQVPATKNNGLIFRIGPMEKEAKGKAERMVMKPVLWEFRNDTDWHFKEGQYSHPLGPDVKDVTLNYSLYYAGLQYENTALKAGDFILASKGHYGPAWNSPVTATVLVNDTPLNSFMIAPRDLVITSLLKQGKNEIKLVSTRVNNAIRDNDIELQIAGPAEWNVQKAQYVVAPIVQFQAMQGWKLDPKTGKRVNPVKPESETIERVIPFFLKEGPKAATQ